MKILLINSPLLRLKEVLSDYFPLGLGYLAAVLRDNGEEVKIYNVDKGPEEQKFASFDNLNRIKSHEKYKSALVDNNHYVWLEVAGVLRDFKPDIVGISTMSTTFPSALKIAGIAKELDPGCKIILGGPHPTAMPEEALSSSLIDFVVRGEGEATLVELVNKLKKSPNDLSRIDGLSFKDNGRIIHNKNRRPIADLDQIPFPAKDLVMFKDLYLYPNNRMSSIITSRGCPFNCKFCQARFIWGRKVRYRSVEKVLDEIESIIKLYDPPQLSIQDDSFTIDKRRVIELCKGMQERGIKFKEGWNCLTRLDIIDKEVLRAMKKTGCNDVFVGVESGSDRILKAIGKDITVKKIVNAAKLLNKLGFIWGAFFMVGFPQETKEDIELTKKLMRKLKCDRINLCVFTPYPGCELYDTVKEMGLLPADIDWAKLSHQSLDNYFSPLIPKDEFEKIVIEVADLTERLNTSPLISLRRAYRKKDIYLKNPGAFFRGLNRNLKLIYRRVNKR